MPELEFTLAGRVSLVSDDSCLPGFVDGSDVDDNGALLGDLTFDAVEAMARPRGIVQWVGLEIVVDDVAQVYSDFIGTWSVERSVDQHAQSWSFACPVSVGDPAGVFGSPFTTLGSPLGKSRVTINGIYKTSTGIHRVRLITDGIVDSSRRSHSADGGCVDEFSGVCVAGRYDGEPVTLVLAPGHGLTRDRIVRKMAEQVGVTDFRLETEGQCFKEFQAVDAQFFDRAQELLDTDGRRLLFDANATLINPAIGPAREAALLSFTERDITSAGVSIENPKDPATDVTITGTEQVTRDAGACGITTPPPFSVENRAVFDPVYQSYSQAAASFTRTALTIPGATDTERVRTRTITTLTYRCGQEIHRLVQTYEWFNPLAARYVYGASSVRAGVSNIVFLDAGAADGPNDSTPARLLTVQAWTLTKEVETWTIWNKTGYAVRPGISLPTTDPLTKAYNRLVIDVDQTTANPRLGFKLGTIVETRAYYATKASLKLAPAPGITIEDTDYINGQEILASGEGVGQSRETFQAVQLEIDGVDCDEKGYVTHREKTTGGWRVVPGVTHWYAGGVYAGAAQESFGLLQTETESWVQLTEKKGTVHVAFVRDQTGQRVQGRDDVVEDVDGGGPSVDRLPIDENTGALTETELLDSKEADRADSISISARVHSTALEALYRKKVIKTQLPYAESVAELDAGAHLVLQEGSAKVLQLTLAGCNFLLADVLDRGQAIHVRDVRAGVDHDIVPRRVRWYGGAYPAPALTDIEARQYLEAV